MKLFLSFLICLLGTSCATHRMYDSAAIRNREYQTTNIALSEGGLTPTQVRAIANVSGPGHIPIPVDVSVILLKNGYVQTEVEEMFAYDLVQELQESENIQRVTLLPDFLIPSAFSFDAIQELGIRAQTEFVLVFDIDAAEFFHWRSFLAGEHEIVSSISFIMVDSASGALLTTDRLRSSQMYKTRMFKAGEQEAAQKQIFAEQAALMASKFDSLFGGAN